MKTKLHFGILIVLLTFLGTYLEQTTVPNQQIVIQFSDHTISSEDSEVAIEDIQSKLKDIGVTHIQIGKNYEGQLRITYHSDADVAHIQNILFNADDIKLRYESLHNESNGFPEGQNEKDYKLNISEIQSNTDFDWGFEGTQVTEFNQKTDRFSYPKTNNSSDSVAVFQTKNSIEVAVLANATVAIAIDHHSYQIPEVRAGPTS